MKTTDPDTIHRDFAAQIEGITPTYPEHTDCRWNEVREGGVQGAMRNFRIDSGPAKPVEDGRLHGIGEQYRYEMRISVGYENLRPQDVQILTQDGVDLRRVLEPRVGQLVGLLKPLLIDFEPTAYGEDGRVTECEYIWQVDYMHDTGLGN